MKADVSYQKVRHFTAWSVTALLAASAICLALRHAADRRRECESGSGAASTRSPVDPARPRDSHGRDEFFSRRPADREEMRERIARMRACPGDIDRTRNLLQMLDALRPADFPLLCEILESEGDDDTKMRDVAISAWAEIDPAAALEHELKRKRTDGQADTVLNIWAERHPMAALDWLVSHDQNGKPVDQVLKKLAQDDPAAALSWARAHDEAESTQGKPHSRLAAALQGMVPGHLDEAIRGLASLPDDLRRSLLFPVSAGMAKTLDDEGRHRWLESLPEGGDRDAAAAALIGGMETSMSVKQRLALLAEYPEAIAQPGLDRFFRHWALSDSGAAVQALDRIPAGDLHDAALRNTVQGMVQGEDAKGALELMNRDPEAIDAVTLMSWFDLAATNAHDWPLAFSQLPRVADGSFREQAYLQIMNSWLFTDHDGARAWLDGHNDVPEKVRKALEGR